MATRLPSPALYKVSDRLLCIFFLYTLLYPALVQQCKEGVSRTIGFVQRISQFITDKRWEDRLERTYVILVLKLLMLFFKTFDPLSVWVRD